MAEDLELASSQDDNEKVNPKELIAAVKKQHPRLFNGINKEKQAEIVQAFSVVMQKHHSGPLPTPEDLERYAEVIPNGGERIMVMAEKEQQFRHDITTTLSKRQLNQSSTGQWMGFLITIAAILSGVGLIYLGKDTSGLVLILTAIGTVAAIFVIGQFKKSKEDK